jgi:hypothetical protein
MNEMHHKESDLMNNDTLTVQEAAKLMGKSQDFVRIGLQRSLLPFGYAVKTGEQRYSYFISKQKFIEATGIQVKD